MKIIVSEPTKEGFLELVKSFPPMQLGIDYYTDRLEPEIYPVEWSQLRHHNLYGYFFLTFLHIADVTLSKVLLSWFSNDGVEVELEVERGVCSATWKKNGLGYRFESGYLAKEWEEVVLVDDHIILSPLVNPVMRVVRFDNGRSVADEVKVIEGLVFSQKKEGVM